MQVRVKDNVLFSLMNMGKTFMLCFCVFAAINCDTQKWQQSAKGLNLLNLSLKRCSHEVEMETVSLSPDLLGLVLLKTLNWPLGGLVRQQQMPAPCKE